MGELCVKGAVVALARDDVRHALASGRLDPGRLEAILRSEDRALLDEAPDPGAWVPVAHYERLLRALLEGVGEGDPEYLVGRGRESADALLRAGAPRHLALPGADSVGDWFERAGHLLVTLPSALFSEGRWKLAKAEGGRLFTLSGEGLGRMPMNVARIVEGALQRLASRVAGRDVRVDTQQPAEGHVVFVATSA